MITNANIQYKNNLNSQENISDPNSHIVTYISGETSTWFHENSRKVID